MEADAVTALPYGAMVMGLGGGLALFLYGMRVMTRALSLAAGGGMKRLLAGATRNRYTAAGAGAIATAVVQSSSVMTVLVVGFISAGLLTAQRAVGVVIGANVGTTITAQIVAFKVTASALALIGVGFVIELLARRQRLKHLGDVLLGLGLIFLGMNLMSEAMHPLRAYPPFLDLMARLGNPLAGAAVGAAFTALVQSSSATTGVVIVLAGQGLIDLRAGIALVLGANVGTCVTAMLAAIGRPREAMRIAVVHVAFNLIGVLLWIGFVPQLAWLARAISPGSPALTGLERIAADAPRQIANAHTVFNVANALIFIWLTGPLAWLAARLVPEPRRRKPVAGAPRFLDPYFLQQPDLALDRVRDELAHLGGSALAMVRDGFEITLAGDEADLAALRDRDEAVDHLHAAIVDYLGRLSAGDLIEGQVDRLYAQLSAANYLEQIGDVVESVLVELGRQRVDVGFAPSPESRRYLQELHAHVIEGGEIAIRALAHGDRDLAAQLAERKAAGKALAERARQRVGKRLGEDRPERLDLYRWESDCIEALDRLHTLFRRIAALV